MSNLGTRARILLAALAVLVLGSFAAVEAAQAGGSNWRGSVADGEPIERDVFLSGDYVQLDDTVDGDVVAIGRTIVIAGDINGSLVAIAENVSVLGKVENSIYAGAVKLDLWPSSTVGRSVYFVGARIVTQQASEVGRDLVAASLGADLSGVVGRGVNALVGPFEWFQVLTSALNREWRLFTGPLFGGGDSAQSTPGASTILASRHARAAMARPAESHGPTMQEAPGEPSRWALWGLGRLRMFISLLIVGLLAVWVAPPALDRVARQARIKTWPSTGYGLVALMTGFGGAGLLLVVFLVAGIALLAVTLAPLAWTFLGLSFSALGLAFFSFLAYVMYGSQVVVSYLIGRLILDRWAPKAAARKVWPLLLGIVAFSILRSIPMLGWVIGLYGALLGLGAAWLAIRECREGRCEIGEEPGVEEPQPESPPS